MNESMLLTSAFVLGLFSAPHCLGMCGGLVSAMGLKDQNKSVWLRLAGVLNYNFGRLFSYAMLGLLAGFLGMTFQHVLPGGGDVLRLMAGGLLVLMGFYIGGWWLALRHLEQAVYGLWTRTQAFFGKVGGRGGNGSKLLGGMLWGCLPCGLVYSALSMAMTQQTPWHGALFMVTFGMGTLPVMTGAGLLSTSFGSWIRKKSVKTGAGVMMICYGIWTVAGVFGMDHSEHHGSGGHHEHAGHSM